MMSFILSRWWGGFGISALMEGRLGVSLHFEGPRLSLVYARKSAGLNNLSQATSNTETGDGHPATQGDFGCMYSESGLSNGAAYRDRLWIVRAYCIHLLLILCSVASCG